VKPIQEVPGALERPGATDIELLQDDDGSLEIRIPSRGTKVMAALSCFLAVDLLLFFLFGFFFFVLQKNVAGFVHVPTFRIGTPAIIFFWLLLECTGAALLYSIMHSAFSTETIRFDRTDITVIQSFFKKRTISRFPLEEVNGFRLRHDPVGFNPSKLSIVVRGKSQLVAEHAHEFEREWINSIAQVYLKQLSR